MKKNLILFLSLLAVSLIFTPVIVFAQNQGSGPPQSVGDIIGLFKKAVTYLYEAFYIVAVGYILWAAFTFLRAGGDSKKVEEGKQRLTYAVIAIIIALIASGVSTIINNFLTNK
jgi:hypothetical protein